jgi:hypothetical protein
MVKDFIIVILLILLALCSYLLYDSRETIFGDWPLLGSGRELELKKSDKAPDLDQNDIYKTEILKPKPTPETNRNPAIGLDLDTIKNKNRSRNRCYSLQIQCYTSNYIKNHRLEREHSSGS